MSRLVSLLLAAVLGLAATQRSFFAEAIASPGSSAVTGIQRQTVVVDEAISPDNDALSEEIALFRAMHASVVTKRDSGAFLAALDQSGGSTPKALKAYGMGPEEGNYEIGTER